MDPVRFSFANETKNDSFLAETASSSFFSPSLNWEELFFLEIDRAVTLFSFMEPGEQGTLSGTDSLWETRNSQYSKLASDHVV